MTGNTITVKALRAEARRLDVRNRSIMTTDRLREAVAAAQAWEAAEATAELIADAPAELRELVGACITYYAADKIEQVQARVDSIVIRNGGYMLRLDRHDTGDADYIVAGEVGDVLEPAAPPAAEAPADTLADGLAVMAAAREAAARGAQAAEAVLKAHAANGTRAAAGSAIVAALEAAWAALQAQHVDLPDVVIITGSGAKSATWGHHWPERWVERITHTDTPDGAVAAVYGGTDEAGQRVRRAELFISGERLACGAALTFQTLTHEAAHALAHVRGIKDTSRQGRYHNREFVRVAESLGLRWPADRTPHSTIGFSAVELAEGTAERYADVIAGLASAITLHLALPAHMGGAVNPGDLDTPKMPRAVGGAGGAGGKGRNNPVAVCQCPDPRKLRMARSTLERAPVICGECREEFTIPDAD